MTRGQSGFLATVKTIVWKDFIVERKTRQTLSVMLVFSLAVSVVFNFALGARAISADINAARNAAVGFLWSTILLAGILGLNRSLAAEQENNALSALLLAPIDRAAIFIGKVVSLTTFVFLVELILLPVFVVFFNRPFWRPAVWGVVALGTVGFVIAGILVGAMSMQSRRSEVLLPVLLLPLSLPAVLSAATVTAALIEPEMPAFSDISLPLLFVIVFDLLMLIVGVSTFHFVVEE